MEPKQLLSQKFKNLKRKHLFRAFLTFFILCLIITIVVLASVKNEKIIYKDKPVSVSQTNAREIKNLTQVIAKAQEDKALLEAQQKPENNAKIKALTTLITQLQTTKKTIEDNAQDIERFRLKIKRLEEEKKALNTQLEAAKQDKSNSAKIRELEGKISQKDRQIKDKNAQINTKNTEISFLVKRKNALEEEKANAPAIFEELKELKKLKKQKIDTYDDYFEAREEYMSKFAKEKQNQGVELSPELKNKLELSRTVDDMYQFLIKKIKKDIEDDKY